VYYASTLRVQHVGDIPPLARVNLHREVLLDDASVRDPAISHSTWGLIMAAVNRHWRREFLRYVCCTLPAAFYPIVFLYAARLVTKGKMLTRSELVADGGVLSIAIALAVDALFRLLASNRQWYEFKMVLASFTVWTIGLGSFFYAFRWANGTANSVVFFDLCFLVIAVSIILAGFCRFLPEDD
jgi:hypothetical protein